MTSTVPFTWQEANEQYLAIAIARVRTALQQYIASAQGQPTPEAPPTIQQYPLTPPPALQTLCTAFGLTSFERDLLVLCAGVELSGSLAQLCATAQGSLQLAYLTFSLGLAALPDAHWSALAPTSPLRHWRLIEVGNGESLTQSRLRIDERVLHYLNGISYLDDRLRGLVEPAKNTAPLPPSHQQLVERLVVRLTRNTSSQLIQLCGGEPEAKEAIAITACAALGLNLHTLRVTDLPTTAAERDALARLWEREAVLSRSALLVDCEVGENRDKLLPFLETVQSIVLVATRDPLHLRRPALRLDINRPTSAEQRQLWQNALGGIADQDLDPLIAQFHLSAAAIQTICSEDSLSATDLWDTCRIHARTRLDDMAQRIQPVATWDDLILPEPQCRTLREIVAQVQQRITVYETWGVAAGSANGLGVSALFAGASGTGKTLAAEVLAQELRLDLYRIDLSQVVSKYIGETEKNLRRVFDAAEAGGAILLFDEADALFGKRSEVKDSHDRYANIEVSYLLQRMEAYRGLAILTTNLRGAIDSAFLRRIRFVVQFPFPDVAQRLDIWRRMFPPKLPTKGLDLNRLAQLNVPGGNIRTIALNAAFLAADAKEPVQMKHLLRATQSEYLKLEKTLTDAEVSGWI
ncbi:MAG: AAA family ATPase [Komarekiella atlantica HA4396-MV6]|jgi:ATP-dependent 26S proteasome regulatory subunit|nr:AAA family ATPase [Komarekiella atlantica HA4396-MV6]